MLAQVNNLQMETRKIKVLWQYVQIRERNKRGVGQEREKKNGYRLTKGFFLIQISPSEKWETLIMLDNKAVV